MPRTSVVFRNPDTRAEQDHKDVAAYSDVEVSVDGEIVAVVYHKRTEAVK